MNSKRFQLRGWLELPDAASHLSKIFEEEITEADMLRFALDRHLTLSVHFVNHARAKRGKTVTKEEVIWETRPMTPDFEWAFHNHSPELIQSLDDGRVSSFQVMRSLNIDDERFINLDEEVTTIEGIWDLSMIGNERLDVEHQYQMLTNGPSVTLEGLEGAFVERNNGPICQLQGRIPAMRMLRRGNEHGKCEKHFVANDSLSEESLAEKMEEGEKRHFKPKYHYVPAAGLPVDSVLVVRTQALRDLQLRFSTEDSLENNSAPYLDNKHAFHAKELQIAVEAWTALYADKPPSFHPQHGHKQYINQWLKAKYPLLGTNAQDRISTIINPNPKGGAPKQ